LILATAVRRLQVKPLIGQALYDLGNFAERKFPFGPKHRPRGSASGA